MERHKPRHFTLFSRESSEELNYSCGMYFQKDINPVTGAKPICDLVDFYNRWPELRGSAKSILDHPDLREDEREVLVWLMILADRIGPADLADV